MDRNKGPRICYILVKGHSPFIYAKSSEIKGDLEAKIALNFGLIPSDVKIKELLSGGLYCIQELTSYLIGEKFPQVESWAPFHWAYPQDLCNECNHSLGVHLGIGRACNSAKCRCKEYRSREFSNRLIIGDY